MVKQESHKLCVVGSIPTITTKIYGSVAQLVEQLFETQRVVGSIPAVTHQNLLGVNRLEQILGFDPR